MARGAISGVLDRASMRTVVALPLSLVLASVLLACSGQAAPPKEVTVKVVYQGSGVWDRVATRTLGLLNCHHQLKSNEGSSFAWTVTWNRVIVPLDAGNAQ